jgi:magnesium transporter
VSAAAEGHRALAEALLEAHPLEAARLLESRSDAQAAARLQGEPAERVARVVERMTPDRAARVISELDEAMARRLLERLPPQRAAALLARQDEEEREAQLARVSAPLARELRELATFPPDTAGSLMDPRATSFRPETPVREVIRRLRKFRNRRIQDVFLVDEEGRLVGVVSLQDVVLSGPDQTLEGLSRTPHSVQGIAPRDEIVEELERHRIRSLPVVDFEGRLIGVVRQEGLVAAAQQQATATALKMVGASQDERALSPPLFAVRKRLPWLQINLLTAFLAASVVGIFESTIASVTALAVLLPVVAGQSGNTGAQALAVTMRGLALREIRIRHWMRVTLKEILAGATNGVAVAITTAAAVWLWSGSPGLAAVICISMVISMTAAGLAGATIPMILTALRQDPAQASSIILTTVTDVVGFFSFLGIATLLMDRL